MLGDGEEVFELEGEAIGSTAVAEDSRVGLANGGIGLAPPGRRCRFGAVDIKYHAGSNSKGIRIRYVRGRRRDSIIVYHGGITGIKERYLMFPTEDTQSKGKRKVRREGTCRKITPEGVEAHRGRS